MTGNNYKRQKAMSFDKEKLAQIARQRSETARIDAESRKKNRDWLRISQEIALGLHYYLRTSGMTQRDMADKMGVSAMYVGKLLKGGENMTLETICKIQRVIGVDLISVTKPYVNRMVVCFSAMPQFSDSAVSSVKFHGGQQTRGVYISAIGDAA